MYVRDSGIQDGRIESVNASQQWLIALWMRAVRCGTVKLFDGAF
jgi:hypothetical protein